MRSIEDIQENFKRGIIDLVILTLLEKEDMYPYQINQELQSRTKGVLTFYLSSLYTPIRRMLQNGEISERKVSAGERRYRNYYHMEENGRQYLAQLRREYANMMEGIALLNQDREESK